VKAETARELVEVLRAGLGELGEDVHLHGAEESLGGPEGEASLKDLLGRRCRGRHFALRIRIFGEAPII
jgi:hypothetical protein